MVDLTKNYELAPFWDVSWMWRGAIAGYVVMAFRHRDRADDHAKELATSHRATPGTVEVTGPIYRRVPANRGG